MLYWFKRIVYDFQEERSVSELVRKELDYHNQRQATIFLILYTDICLLWAIFSQYYLYIYVRLHKINRNIGKANSPIKLKSRMRPFAQYR